jgi:hypothetical protein
MTTLVDKLEHIVGRALGPDEVLVEDHGDGQVLTSWNVSGVTQPTQSEIDAISDSDANSTIGLRGLRIVRDKKLAETDWTQSRDVTLTNDAAWATYRQALRDITDTYSDLDSVVWPTKPE